MKLHAATRLKASKTYRYAMVNRPVGIGCCPKDGLIASEDRPARGKPHFDMARNGVAVYDRKLTPKETKSFEMALMADASELKEIAKDVADTMRRYAKSYIEMAEGPADERDDFVKTVYDRLKDQDYYQPSVGDLSEFADLVVKELK